MITWPVWVCVGKVPVVPECLIVNLTLFRKILGVTRIYITICPFAPGYLADPTALLGSFDPHALADQGRAEESKVIRNPNGQLWSSCNRTKAVEAM
jgi:hypothetical protein